MEVRLSRLATFLNTTHSGVDVTISGVSTDSRHIQPDELFIALKGDQFDGHDYVGQAIERGAAAVLVSQPIAQAIPCIKVVDTQQALLELGKAWRNQFNLAVIAITGSCGKTSTRALLQSILSRCAPTLASERSYNNRIGVPLTLLKLNPDHRYAVIEVGANHAGEIADLVEIVRPKVSVLTLAAASHLAGFGSLEGVARAKAEIFNTLSETETAVINADDDFANFWCGSTTARKLKFGLTINADVRAEQWQVDAAGRYCFQLQTPQSRIKIQLGLMGKHNVYNALAAATAAVALDIPLEKIKQGLEAAVAEDRRLIEQTGLHKAVLIDDSYNANPASVQAAIEVLAARSGISVLVLGDMLELGDEAEAYHRKVGESAKKAGIQRLFCLGPNTKQTAEAYGESARHFASHEALISALKPLLNDQVTVLIKGSNAMGMQKITKSLLE